MRIAHRVLGDGLRVGVHRFGYFSQIDTATALSGSLERWHFFHVADCCSRWTPEVTAENIALTVPENILTVARPDATRFERRRFFGELSFHDSNSLFPQSCNAHEEIHVFGFSFADLVSLR